MRKMFKKEEELQYLIINEKLLIKNGLYLKTKKLQFLFFNFSITESTQ